jgi:hypothetical protein
MANIFTQNPIYLDTDTTTGAGTNWRGTNGGAQLNPGNLPATAQQFSGPVSRQWGIKPWLVVVSQADGTVPTVIGNILVTDPQTTGGAGQLLKFPVVSATQLPVILDDGFSTLWRDFVVTGLTATKTSIQIFYRM